LLSLSIADALRDSIVISRAILPEKSRTAFERQSWPFAPA
jgi:hypothetical protein